MIKRKMLHFTNAILMFFTTAVPLCGFGSSVFGLTLLFATSAPLLLAILFAAPYFMTGISLGIWYGVSQYRRGVTEEKGLLKLFGQLQTACRFYAVQQETGEKYPHLFKLVNFLRYLDQQQLQQLYQRYQEQGGRQLSLRQLQRLQQISTKPLIGQELVKWVKESQAPIPRKKSFSMKKVPKLFSEKWLVPSKSIYSITLLTFSILSLAISLVVSLSLVAPGLHYILIPVGFIGVTTLALFNGVLATVMLMGLQKGILKKQQQVSVEKKRLDEFLRADNELQELEVDSRLLLNTFCDLFNPKLQSLIQIPLHFSKKQLASMQQLLKKKRNYYLGLISTVLPRQLPKFTEKQAKKRSFVDGVADIFFTSIPALGIGSTVANVLLGSAIITSVPFALTLVAIIVPSVALGYAVIHGIGRYKNHRHKEIKQLAIINQLRKEERTTRCFMLCQDPALQLFADQLQQLSARELESTYARYKAQGGDFLDLDDLYFLYQGMSKKKNAEIVLDCWGKYKSQKLSAREELFYKRPLLKRVFSIPENSFAAYMMRPARVAQSSTLFAFNLLSVLTLSVTGASFFGFIPALPMLITGILGICAVTMSVGLVMASITVSLEHRQQMRGKQIHALKREIDTNQQRNRQIKRLIGQQGLISKCIRACKEARGASVSQLVQPALHATPAPIRAVERISLQATKPAIPTPFPLFMLKKKGHNKAPCCSKLVTATVSPISTTRSMAAPAC